MNNDQIKGILDRAAAVLATMLLGWLVKRGYMGESDAATLTPAIILLPSLAWGWWRNSTSNILKSASEQVGADGTKPVIVASPELAQAVPSSNVVSNALPAPKIVEAVKEAKKEGT